MEGRDVDASAGDMIAAVTGDDADLVAALLAEDPSLASVRDRDGVSVLMLSRYRGHRGTTEALLAVDPDLDVFEATALGYIDRLRERLDADAWAVKAFSADGFTALHFAAFFGKTEAARTLIEAGASVDVYSTNEMRVQPLHSGAASRSHEVCRLLIASGADVNATQRHDYSPLHAAAQQGDAELVELFLSAGADPTAATEPGDTPADLAEAAGHPDVARRLRHVAADRR